MIRSNFSSEELERFVASFSKPLVKHIRYNPAKAKEIEREGRAIDWCSEGRTLLESKLFTTDPLFHAGAYYVQEASSMYIEQIFKSIILPEYPQLTVLDLCAAPGGKSTHISSLISPHGVLVANEVIRSRASILRQNIVKWGLGNTIVSSSDPRDFSKLKSCFDVILADVPCSGEGMFRKSEKAVEEWSVEGVELCQQRSRRILADVWNSLNEGGYLIFSTCTFNTIENEKNVEWLLDNFDVEAVDIQLPLYDQRVVMTDTQGVKSYRFYPHRVESEGIFITVLRKSGTSNRGERKESSKVSKSQFQKLSNREIDALKLGDFATNNLIVKHNNNLHLLSENQLRLLDRLSQNLSIHYFGIELGEPIKGSLKPSHSCAMWANLPEGIYPKVELDRESALEFLRRKSIDASPFENGYNIVTFQSHPLGFVKRIGNRVNNNYPKELMILHY